MEKERGKDGKKYERGAKGDGKRVEQKRGKRKWGWWDKECEDKKREVRRELRGRMKGKMGITEGKEKNIESCVKEERGKEMEKRAKDAKRENKLINRERKRKTKINKGIAMEWKEHFIRLLGEMEGRVVLGEGRREREEIGEEKELSREEISEVLWKLKEE